MSDLRFENHGSLFLVHPTSKAGTEWLFSTAPDDAQFLGDAMAVELRYVEGVATAARDSGLEVE